MLTFADIFSGCGGLSHSFYNNANFKGLLAVDHWTAAGKVFQENHPKMPFELRDMYDQKEVEEISEKLKNNCDILLGGPPCQGFSTLGKRKDNDKRSSLVETFLNICINVKPKIIIMENVLGIKSKKHQSGKYYPDFIKDYLQNTKNEISYDLETIQISTLDYGLAQTRVRWLLIAVRKDFNLDSNILEKILIEIKNRRTKKTKNLKDVIGDLPFIESGEGSDEITTYDGNKKIKIFNHKAMKHSNKLIERFSYVPVGGGLLDVPRELLTDHLIKMINGDYGSGGHAKNIYGRMDWKKPSGTIIAGIDKITCGRFVHPEANRLLTPRECARIQSFPDDFVFTPAGGAVNQYYLIGNAVPPKISSVLAGAIKSSVSSSLVYETAL